MNPIKKLFHRHDWQVISSGTANQESNLPFSNHTFTEKVMLQVLECSKCHTERAVSISPTETREVQVEYVKMLFRQAK